MITPIRCLAAALAAALGASAAAAASPKPSDGAARVKQAILEHYPGVEFTKVEPSPVDGWYAVTTAGKTVWVDADGQYMLRGQLTNLDQSRKLNPNVDADAAPSHPGDYDSAKALHQALVKHYGLANLEDVEPSPAPGWYQGRIGATVRYVSADAGYLVTGDLLSLSDGQNLTVEAERRARTAVLDRLAGGSFVVYPPDGVAKATLTVFIDTTCPYCKRYHEQLAKLRSQYPVRIRYAMYPRKGLRGKGAQQLARAWCADNRRDAINRAFMGQSLPGAGCQPPIQAHMQAAKVLDVKATPTTFTDDGQKIRGLRSARQLTRLLGLEPSDKRAQAPN